MSFNMHDLRIMTLIFLISIASYAEEAVKPKTNTASKIEKIVPQNPTTSKGLRSVTLEYGSAAWNPDPKKMDSAFMFMRDKDSGKVVKVLLEETEPDSSTFSGNFSLNFKNDEEFRPEVYVPPPGMRLSDADAQKFNTMINKGKVNRKPVVFRTDAEGKKRVDIYDTKEQAQKALDTFKEQAALAAKAKAEASQLTKPIPNESTLATAQLVDQKNKIDALAVTATKQATDRLRLEQIEKQKNEEKLKSQKLLAASERLRREEQARKLAEEALAKYQAGDYPAAEVLFRESVNLNPSENSVYLRYGISLYRNEKYNEALVTMKLAKGSPTEEIEKNYFMGLTFYRLKELNAGLKSFDEVKSKGDPVLSPSAAFYKGIIYYGMEDFKKSKPEFEYVLDKSSDPRMDEKAEEYIEKIARLQTYRKNQAKRFVVGAVAGLMYDSNVIYAPDNQSGQGTQTDKDAARLLGVVSGDLRFINNDRHEFNFVTTGTTILSLNNSMTGLHSELGLADPYLVNVALPYTFKTTLRKKGYKLLVKPGYEILNMDTDNSGTAENIQNSATLNVNNTFIMSPNWFSAYEADFRSDDSRLSTSTGSADSDAIKVKVGTTQTFFMDKSKKRAIIGGLAYINNSAKGNDKKFNRYDLSISYMAPFMWDAMWNGNLSIYHLGYDKAATVRKDRNAALTLGVSKPIKEWFTWGLSGNYTTNASNISSSSYTKYTITTTASFNFGW